MTVFRSVLRLDADPIVATQELSAAEIDFHCLNGNPPDEKLDLFEFTTGQQSGLFGKVIGRDRTSPADLQLRDNETVIDAITKDPEVMHGVPVFRGTRVPVQTLFEYLEGGETLEDFLIGFPTVPRSLALEALDEARRLLLTRAS